MRDKRWIFLNLTFGTKRDSRKAWLSAKRDSRWVWFNLNLGTIRARGLMSYFILVLCETVDGCGSILIWVPHRTVERRGFVGAVHDVNGCGSNLEFNAGHRNGYGPIWL